MPAAASHGPRHATTGRCVRRQPTKTNQTRARVEDGGAAGGEHLQGLGHLRCEAREPGEPVGPEHEQAEREDREREPVEHVLVAAADGYETEGRSDGEHWQEGEEDRVVGLKGGEDHGGDACHERGRRQQDVRLADLMAPDVESPDGEGPDGAEVPEAAAGAGSTAKASRGQGRKPASAPAIVMRRRFGRWCEKALRHWIVMRASTRSQQPAKSVEETTARPAARPAVKAPGTGRLMPSVRP